MTKDITMEDKTLIEINNTLAGELGDIIEKIILFGSRAHGFSDKYSDYDILIILNTEIDWQLEWKIYDICFNISLENDILIDVKIISSSDLNTIRGRQPYIQEALSTGITL